MLLAGTPDNGSRQARIQGVERLPLYGRQLNGGGLGRTRGLVAAGIRAAVIGLVEPLGIVEVWHVSGGTLQTQKPARSIAADLLGASLTVWGSVTSA